MSQGHSWRDATLPQPLSVIGYPDPTETSVDASVSIHFTTDLSKFSPKTRSQQDLHGCVEKETEAEIGLDFRALSIQLWGFARP